MIRNSLDTTSCEVGKMEIGIRQWLALIGVGRWRVWVRDYMDRGLRNCLK